MDKAGSSRSGLTKYRAKRDFAKTAEPAGKKAVSDQRIEFVYDYLGRRIELRVSAVPDVQRLRWQLIKRRRFVWSGWLMLVEVDAGVDTPAVNNPLRRYTWGRDLGGTAVSAVDAVYGAPALQGAGGVACLPDGRGRPPGAGPGVGEHPLRLVTGSGSWGTR